MFHFEVSCSRLTRLWPLALCLTLTVHLSHAPCPKPGREGNAIVPGVLQDEYAEGSTVTYQCIEGYVSSEVSRSITCTNGEWSRLRLKCEKMSCGSPDDVVNGVWGFDEGIQFGATAVLTCNEGYKLAGSISTMQCEVGGWSGGVFVCEDVKCDLPPEIQNGTSVMNGEKGYLTYQETIIYSCNENYVLIGEAMISCSEDGELHPRPPKCQRLDCPQPIVDFAVRLQGRPPYIYKSFVVFKCYEGHEMNGSAKMTCELDGWTDAPVCQKKSTTASTTPRTSTTTRRTSTTTTTKPRGSAACTGSLCSGIFSALVQRVVIALLIPVSWHLSL